MNRRIPKSATPMTEGHGDNGISLWGFWNIRRGQGQARSLAKNIQPPWNLNALAKA